MSQHPAINRLASLIEELIEANADDAKTAYATRRATIDVIRELGDEMGRRFDYIDKRMASQSTNPEVDATPKELSDLEHLAKGRVPLKWLGKVGVFALRWGLPLVGGGAILEAMRRLFPGHL